MEELRLRRLLYRIRRGMNELDLLLGSYLEHHPPLPSELPRWEALLERENDELYRWLVEGQPCPFPLLAPLVEELRRWRPGRSSWS